MPHFVNQFNLGANNRTYEIPVVTSLSGVTGEPNGLIILDQSGTRTLYTFDDDGQPVLSGGGSAVEVVADIPTSLEPSERVWVTATNSEWIGADPDKGIFPTLSAGTPWPVKGYKELKVIFGKQQDEAVDIFDIIINDMGFNLLPFTGLGAIISLGTTEGIPENYFLNGSKFIPEVQGTGTSGQELTPRFTGIRLLNSIIRVQISNFDGISTVNSLSLLNTFFSIKEYPS